MVRVLYSRKCTLARVEAGQLYRCVVTGPDGAQVTTDGVPFSTAGGRQLARLA